MNSSGINFKVYCVTGDNTEVKRFFVDTGAVTSFVFMKEKLKAVFPHLRDAEFKITWKDSDGDLISITNDDDFITALTEMNDNPKVLYLNAESKNVSEDNPRVFRVVCDVCQKGISGYRYKCIECPDYDLCGTCESNGNHSEHMVLRLPNSNAPFAKFDRKMMHNAARALKKSAFHVAKEAHRCARDSMKFGDKDRSNRHEGASTSTPNANAEGCPFSADMGEMLTQNINPLIEMFTKNMQNQGEAAPTSLSDLVRSVADAFTNILNPDQSESAANTTENQQASQTTNQEKQDGSNQNENKSTNIQPSVQQTQVLLQPSAPAENAASNPNNNPDMEWTIVSDNDESTSQASATSQTSKTLPPPPPQDPRMMRGLAQLYEMGFSNENHFLNYMLETHNYNVGDVVKAILQLK